ncbi:MAG: hypothetical protein HYW86_04535 [Candidatus Roizmanbacteria bacterium]|nr:MAG: hypothetical protein HYW86_04535 [Candidatus Roizmanbacteria bacterium]
MSILVLALISYLNIPPKGYLIGGGDFYQRSYLRDNYFNFFFTWSEKIGVGHISDVQYAVFFLPFYILDLLDNVAAQQFLFMFIFIFLSFISFYLSQRYFVNNNSEKKYSYLFSLLYAINPFTFSVLRTSAGYHPFFFLYPFIPLFFGLIYSYLKNAQNYINKELAVFIIVSFFLSVSFGNFAFFISLFVFVSLFCFFLILTNEVNISKKTFLKFAVLLLSFIFSTLYNVASQIPLMLVLNRQISNSEIPLADIWSWMTYQRLSLQTQVLFNTDYDKSAVFLFSTVLFMLFIASMIYYKSRLSRIMSILAVISIFVTSKGLEIFPSWVVKPIFTLPLINSLRTGNKSYIFLPFFILIVLLLCYRSTKETIVKYLFILSSILIILSCFPLLNGKILTNYSPYYAKDENYLTAKYTFIFHLPKPYVNINKAINPNEQNRILVLPYSVINSVGWMNYTNWKYVGVDPVISLVNKPLVNPNYYLYPSTWNYGELWNRQSEEESLWIFPFASITNSKYILYHKDVDPQFIDQTMDKIKYYQKLGLISKIQENNYFIFYKINEKFFVPRVYVPKKVTVTDKRIEDFAELLGNEIQTNDFAVYFTEQNLGKNTSLLEKTSSSVKSKFEFKRINPVKIRIAAHNVKDSFPIIFSEGFHDEWKAYLVKTEKRTSLPAGNILETLTGKGIGEDKHFKANGYANSWIINPVELCIDTKFCRKNSDGTYDMELIFEFHRPQMLFYTGLIISGITLLISLIYLIRKNMLKKIRKNHRNVPKV